MVKEVVEGHHVLDFCVAEFYRGLCVRFIANLHTTSASVSLFERLNHQRKTELTMKTSQSTPKVCPLMENPRLRQGQVTSAKSCVWNFVPDRNFLSCVSMHLSKSCLYTTRLQKS
jgi:hypothetical protein